MWVAGGNLRATEVGLIKINGAIGPATASYNPAGMLGKTANAILRIDAGGGKVFTEGEYWNAVSETPVESGQTVEVIGIEGLTLKVKPKNQ